MWKLKSWNDSCKSPRNHFQTQTNFANTGDGREQELHVPDKNNNARQEMTNRVNRDASVAVI